MLRKRLRLQFKMLLVLLRVPFGKKLLQMKNDDRNRFLFGELEGGFGERFVDARVS